MQERGFRIKTYCDIYRSRGYLAGDDQTRAAELMAASAILSGLIGPGIIVAASVCICPARRSTSAREPHNEARPKKHMSDPGKPRSSHAAKRAGASRNAGHAA